MVDKKFEEMNTEEKLKWLHDDLQNFRNKAHLVVEEIKGRLTKLEEGASKPRG